MIFRENLTILPCGRYEVGLPMKSYSRNLPDNKELSWERHEKMVKRMKARGFLLQKIFDPIGILYAVTLLPKILLQDTWKLKVVWDIELPPDVSTKFFKWVNKLYLLKEVCLSRFMAFNESSELHVSVDASLVAYSACVFVRTMLDAGTSVSFIRAKTRVAPLKPLTIPRLELMACCIGARLVN
ncbi:hypothetical protein AVEN_37195-1 [Araneus ventricosus]|uniref:Reverse transcriptase/retrotransposon-derived protein RNase H-like domain-containing protein n=1 Tax=Araneus ventricosus TaxID=182803 RepID=A0A4Y2S9I3_ARAVE|nr:hypothetical protein AVEN_37195-1 [Araneus ventricosus]